MVTSIPSLQVPQDTARQLRGTVERRFTPEGVEVDIAFPLAS